MVILPLKHVRSVKYNVSHVLAILFVHLASLDSICIKLLVWLHVQATLSYILHINKQEFALRLAQLLTLDKLQLKSAN